jgi:hypothetical protein
MKLITAAVSDDVAKRLEVEATARNITLEDLAAELLRQSAETPVSGHPDYLALAAAAAQAPSARRSKAQIDAEIERSRNEW